MEIKMTYLTSPKVAGNSAVIAPPKSSTGLNPDIVFDVILSMMSLLAGWLVGVRRPSRKIVSVPRFANVIPNRYFDIESPRKERKNVCLENCIVLLMRWKVNGWLKLMFKVGEVQATPGS